MRRFIITGRNDQLPRFTGRSVPACDRRAPSSHVLREVGAQPDPGMTPASGAPADLALFRPSRGTSSLQLDPAAGSSAAAGSFQAALMDVLTVLAGIFVFGSIAFFLLLL